MIKILSAMLLLVLPVKWSYWLLNIMGHRIHKKARCGFSLIVCDRIQLGADAAIGNMNLVKIERIVLDEKSKIGKFNVLNGPYSLHLASTAIIGKFNKMSRGKSGTSYRDAELKMGTGAIIVSNHYLDLTKSVTFGDYSILAGISSQIWTHGYMHAPEGPERFRVDGAVNIGNNVYIGSGSIINPGVYIAASINVGGGSCVAKSLLQPGMYVSQPLRYIPKKYEDTKAKLKQITAEGLIEEVYEKQA
ncbi:MAG TPA: hypothetical protein VL098_04960 [Flavipsychrobacter sp.]|nr:hypothetical protein [Flavipsychrobacter sp.]